MKNLVSHFRKSKDGFTLTELTVVMVLLGLIIVLATSVTLIVNRTQKLSQLDAKSEGEILKVETAFKDWLALYDSGMYRITVTNNKISVSLSADEENYMEFTAGDARKLSYTENVGYDPHASKTEIKLTAVSEISFRVYNGNIIYCTAKFDDTDYIYTILFCMRSASIQKV